MEELRVSATDFRVHLKDLGNEVARGKAAVVVSRHGLELGVFVNLDEYAEFLQWRNQQSETDAAIEVPSEHPRIDAARGSAAHLPRDGRRNRSFPA